ncbi:ISAs1 family transposase [Nostoc sp. C057]|uniref:ISAs1 family transposase n=1 Tax=Nostoc sp. C057 TaxID=2576903 RepID=UPI0015C37F32|nr:ISAs1 family transposase [Nostoc sp. C057]QLE48715.1 ISAs1 family transposase [Nostoc sp. C057]
MKGFLYFRCVCPGYTTRIVEVFHDSNGIDPAWTGIKSLIRVERIGTRKGNKYHEIVCYISSLIASAKEFALGIRGHWGIENCLHWVKDVVFKEDCSTIRLGNAPANLSIMRASHSIFFVAMVIIPSQLLKDLSLMILTNSFILWNETALPFKRGVGGIDNVLLPTKGLLKHPLKPFYLLPDPNENYLRQLT